MNLLHGCFFITHKDHAEQKTSLLESFKLKLFSYKIQGSWHTLVDQACAGQAPTSTEIRIARLVLAIIGNGARKVISLITGVISSQLI